MASTVTGVGKYEAAIQVGMNPAHMDAVLLTLGIYDAQLTGGAIADGVADTRAAIAALDAKLQLQGGGTLEFSIGTYRVASNLTIRSQTSFEPGAIIKPAAGVTVTLAVRPAADLFQIFDLSNAGSSVVISKGTIVPQWYCTGTGTAADPWLGWETIPYATAKRYEFCDGTYAAATAPNWALPFIAIIGSSKNGTILQHTGAGDFIKFDAGTGVSNGTYATQFKNFLIKGSASHATTRGVFARQVHQIDWDDIAVVNVTTAAMETNFMIGGTLRNFTSSVNEGLSDFMPTDGLVLNGTGGTGPTNALLVENPVIVGVSGIGLRMVLAQGCTIVGGDTESNLTDNLTLEPGSVNNKIMGLWTNADILDNSGGMNTYIGMNTAGTMTLRASQNARLLFGKFGDIVIESTALDTEMDHVIYTGAFTDNGIQTRKSPTVSKFGVSGNAYQPMGMFYTIANNATATIPFSDFGDVRVANVTSGGTLIAIVDSATLTEVKQTGVNYTFTPGNPGTTNVSYATTVAPAGTLSIQNKEGAPKVYHIVPVVQ